MFDDDLIKTTLLAILAIMFVVFVLAPTVTGINSQQHKDYVFIAAMNLSEIKVGQSINLQNYDVELKSGNSSILQVRTSDDGGLFSDNKNVIWGVSAGNTTLMIHDESSNAYKIVKVEVVE